MNPYKPLSKPTCNDATVFEKFPTKPRTEGMHLDQNPFTKPHKDTVQGMVPLLAVTEQTGGLAVVPRTHLSQEKEALQKRQPHLRYAGDWCVLHSDPSAQTSRQKLLLAEPGDLILWDARTVHGGVVGSGNCRNHSRSYGSEENAKIVCIRNWKKWQSDFARMSLTVAMTERSRASEKTLNIRRQGFECGKNFNHTPHEAGTSVGTLRCARPPGYIPCSLSPEQHMLIDGKVPPSS